MSARVKGHTAAKNTHIVLAKVPCKFKQHFRLVRLRSIAVLWQLVAIKASGKGTRNLPWEIISWNSKLHKMKKTNVT